MSSKRSKTLAAIFVDPVKSDIRWRDVEALLRFHDAEVSQGAGSRVRIALNGERIVLHAPHDPAVMDKGAVKSLRRFLVRAGVEP